MDKNKVIKSKNIEKEEYIELLTKICIDFKINNYKKIIKDYLKDKNIFNK